MDDLRYECQRCGTCCRWPGQVKVSDDEIRLIAAFLQIPEATFIQERTRLRANRKGLALLDKPNGECEFLDGNTCLIQDVKPQQCRDFPNGWRIDPDNLCQARPILKGPSRV